jgi:hypothetical protein
MSWIYWKTKETMLNFPESLNYFLCLMNVVTSQVLGWLGVLQLVSERALGPWV